MVTGIVTPPALARTVSCMKTAIALATALILTGASVIAQTNSSLTPQGPTIATPAAQPEMMSLIPAFPVANMQRAIDFYSRLGFALILRSGTNYASMGRDLVQIGLALDSAKVRVNHASAYVNMTLIDDYYNAVKASGIKVTNDLKTQPSNMREFSVVDPDGNSLIFGMYLGPKQ
jgi:predicted enzyme related to lactoylglutathione lyase